MIFHEFGKGNKPLIVFVHGCFQPWQVFMPIAKHFTEEYRVLIPELNGHTSQNKSKFISIEKEAAEIENFIIENCGSEIFALCGLSMGGAVSYTILKNQRLKIRNVILDGAPLVASGKLAEKIMTKNYISIAEKSKARNKSVLKSFCKNFMPEKYLKDYLAFIDNTSEESIRNMIKSVNVNRFSPELTLNGTKLMYLHGTKGNEMISKKSAALIAKHYKEAYVISFKGDKHCECAVYNPDDWTEVAKDFFVNR